MSDELSIPRGPAYRVHRRHGIDPLTRRLMWISGGLVGALVVVMLLWSAIGGHSGKVPVIQAESGPVRVKPANPGGMQIPGLGADVASGQDGATGQLAPPPEVPDPQALARQTAPAPMPTPAAPAATPSPAPAAPAHVATAPPPASPAAPAKVPPAAAPVAPAPAHPVARPEPSGHQMVQLAALTTEAAARQEWERLAKKLPASFSGRHPVISKIEHDGHTLWRLRTGGFATEAEARQFCEELHAKHLGCAVAAF